MIDEPRHSEITEIFEFINQLLPNHPPYIQTGMIGWLPFHYTYASGREGDWATIALASQKNYISIYVCASDGQQYVAEKYKTKLSKASIGKSCIRFKKSADIDWKLLETIILEAVALGPKVT